MERWQVHVTAIEMFWRCAEQYRRRYIEGERIAPGVAQHIGSGTHIAVAKNLTHKLVEGQLLPTEAVAESARDGLNATWEREGVALDEDERQQGENTVRGAAVDTAVALSLLHHEGLAPNLQPSAVERKWALELAGFPFDLAGTIDLQEQTGSLRDLKTSAKSPSADVADRSEQLTAYSLAVCVLDKLMPNKVSLDYLVATKQPKIVTVTSTRDAEDVRAYTRRLECFAHALEKGVFPPARESDWWCYAPETELLTPTGWKRGDKIVVGETVCGYDTHTALLSWQPVLASFNKPWGAPMVHYDGRGLRYCVTPDHRMLVRSMGRGRWRTILASAVVGKGSICYPVSAYLVRPGVDFCDDEIALSGWLCAEGYFARDDPSVCLYQKETGVHYRTLLDLVGRLQYEYTLKQDSGANRIRFRVAHSRLIRTRLQNNKSIPSWLHAADNRQFRIWLDAFVSGDGHRSGPDNCLVNQKDESFIDELQGLCVTHRMSASKGPRRISSTGGLHFALNIMQGITERITESAKAGTHFNAPIADNVWCVTVPTGYVLTRYEGRTLIAGNCSRKWCGYFQSCPYVRRR